MIIHSFGDSHRFHLGEMVKPNLGNSWTMARFGNDSLALIDIKECGVEEGDAVIFCFGEIDCRCHLCRKNTYAKHEDLIDYLCEEYMKAIKRNVERYDDLKVLVFNVVPAVKVTPDMEEKWGEGNVLEVFPFRGSDEQRKTVANYMNKVLAIKCKDYDYTFVDVHDKYCDADGYFDVTKKDIHSHIGIHSKVHVSDFLKEVFK